VRDIVSAVPASRRPGGLHPSRAQRSELRLSSTGPRFRTTYTSRTLAHFTTTLPVICG
jgi:hypothetical protein